MSEIITSHCLTKKRLKECFQIKFSNVKPVAKPLFKNLRTLHAKQQ